MPQELKETRYYLHGDMLNDGERFYDARDDIFVALEDLGEVSPIDIERYKLMKRGLREALAALNATRKKTSVWVYREADNVFADHPLARVHPSTLRAAVRKARQQKQPPGRRRSS